jgi:formylglycine-generating enzyme required for sulfatase activity
LLQGWLAEDAGLLAVLEGVKRASRDWAANARNAAWLTHTADRLAAAERLIGRPDLAANLEPTDQAYLAACRQAEYLARWRARRLHALIIGMLLLISGAGVAYWSWTNRLLLQLWTDLYLRQTVLSLGRERTLLPLAPFQECTRCPEMVVVQTGNVFIGSTEAQESPPHQVTIAKAFAVSKFEVTFAQWDACYELGGCRRRLDDYDWGRGTMPVMFVGWDDAQQYAKWLTRQTGKEYRLLTEAEYEYAARAGSATVYYWGDKFEPKKAHCADCSDGENSRRPISVGSFTPNSYGLYDMLGNVSEWVADCWNDGYDGAPKDGSAWMAGDCSKHVVRGGSYKDESSALRASTRSARVSGFKSTYLGFRVARTLNP